MLILLNTFGPAFSKKMDYLWPYDGLVLLSDIVHSLFSLDTVYLYHFSAWNTGTKVLLPWRLANGERLSCHLVWRMEIGVPVESSLEVLLSILMLSFLVSCKFWGECTSPWILWYVDWMVVADNTGFRLDHHRYHFNQLSLITWYCNMCTLSTQWFNGTRDREHIKKNTGKHIGYNIWFLVEEIIILKLQFQHKMCQLLCHVMLPPNPLSRARAVIGSCYLNMKYKVQSNRLATLILFLLFPDSNEQTFWSVVTKYCLYFHNKSVTSLPTDWAVI